MNKFSLLKIVNPLLGLGFFLQALTGIMLAYGIGINYMEQISELHRYNGFIFIMLVAAHLTLNWAWIKMNIFKKPV